MSGGELLEILSTLIGRDRPGQANRSIKQRAGSKLKTTRSAAYINFLQQYLLPMKRES